MKEPQSNQRGIETRIRCCWRTRRSAPQSNQRGIETRGFPTTGGTARRPQSNQRGIETPGPAQPLRNNCGLNRTSVGLKLPTPLEALRAQGLPQSNQRGIETEAEHPILIRPLPRLNRTSVGLKPHILVARWAKTLNRLNRTSVGLKHTHIAMVPFADSCLNRTSVGLKRFA